MKNQLSSFAALLLISLTGCRTTMTLGGFSGGDGSHDDSRESVCLLVVDSEQHFKAEDRIAVYFQGSDFFPHIMKFELERFFYVVTEDGACSSAVINVEGSLENLYIKGHDIGRPDFLPLSEADSYALVRMVVKSSTGEREEVKARSDEFHTTGIITSNRAMVVVARAAIRDAVKRSVQQLACRRGLTQCIEQKVEEQKIEQPELEYHKIRKEGEPRVEYSIFGYSFASF